MISPTAKGNFPPPTFSTPLVMWALVFFSIPFHVCSGAKTAFPPSLSVFSDFEAFAFFSDRAFRREASFG